VESDKSALFRVLLSVPLKAITKIRNAAERGRNKHRDDLEALEAVGVTEEIIDPTIAQVHTHQPASVSLTLAKTVLGISMEL
jgi:hypothetical protein